MPGLRSWHFSLYQQKAFSEFHDTQFQKLHYNRANPKNEVPSVVADGWIIAQSVANIAAVAVAVPSIIYLAKQTASSAKAASATALASISAISRELQWKVLETPTLQPLLTGASQGLTDEMKREAVRGMLFNLYAFVYEFRKLDQIPDASWSAYKSDMTDFFTQTSSRERWNNMRSVFPREFQDFIEHDILNRPR